MLVRQRQEVQALPRELSDRSLAWEGALNARDAGGLATGDGKAVRRGALVRSDIPTRLTLVGRQSLAAHGIKTIVDVRTTDEVASDRESYPFRDGTITYLNVPFTTGLDDRYQTAASREELNRLDVDVHREGIAAIVRAVADAGPGGVLVHCHAGKDRTGISVALTLAAVGVADEEIADDYALSETNLAALTSEWLDENARDDDDRQRLLRLAMPSREAMLDTLAYVLERYGSAQSYLRSAGVTDEQLARLRQRLLEPTPAAVDA